MGNLKDEILANQNTEDIQQHQLTDSEMSYLKLLNLTLQYHTMAQRIISGFLYYVAVNRLGYKDGVNLQLEMDLNKDNVLTIKLLPDNIAELQQQQVPPAPTA